MKIIILMILPSQIYWQLSKNSGEHLKAYIINVRLYFRSQDRFQGITIRAEK
jgi:hypothetical protein